jgi:hypothetical protein
MGSFIYGLAFHKNQKPRGWLRRVLFRRNQGPRPMFARVVFKKNGTVRPLFETWARTYRPPQLALTGPAGARTDSATLRNAANISAVLVSPPSVEDMSAAYRHGKDPAEVMSETDLAASLGSPVKTRLIVSVGHDNYREVSGGVQLCIQREEKQANLAGHDYLNLHPWQPLPRLAHPDEDPDPYVVMLLNGKRLGISRMSAVIGAVRAIAPRRDVSLVVHHLLGHHPEQMVELAAAAGKPGCFFWLHDFFSLCPSFTLQRNNRAFCHAPDLGSNACSICLFGEERARHVPRIRDLFARLRVHVLSPSEATAGLWSARSGLTPASLTVAPHVRLDWAPRPVPVVPDATMPLMVGYLGLPVPHKGWPPFERLAAEFNDGKTFRFAVLGLKRADDRKIRHQKVHATAADETAMADAVAAMGVDLVLHWPTWPETFSLTTYEAFEGGAFVLTNPISGNVAAAVRATGRGAVLDDEAALHEFFRDGRAEAMARAAREARARQTVTRTMSDMTLPFLASER